MPIKYAQSSAKKEKCWDIKLFWYLFVKKYKNEKKGF